MHFFILTLFSIEIMSSLIRCRFRNSSILTERKHLFQILSFSSLVWTAWLWNNQDLDDLGKLFWSHNFCRAVLLNSQNMSFYAFLLKISECNKVLSVTSSAVPSTGSNCTASFNISSSFLKAWLRSQWDCIRSWRRTKSLPHFRKRHIFAIRWVLFDLVLVFSSGMLIPNFRLLYYSNFQQFLFPWLSSFGFYLVFSTFKMISLNNQ